MATKLPYTHCAPIRVMRSAYATHILPERPTDRRHQTFASGPSPVRQDMRDECDINNIILRYAGTGELPTRLNHREPEYLDVSDVPDLQSALNMVSHAQDILAALRQEAADREASALPPVPPSAPAPPPPVGEGGAGAPG